MAKEIWQKHHKRLQYHIPADFGEFDVRESLKSFSAHSTLNQPVFMVQIPKKY